MMPDTLGGRPDCGPPWPERCPACARNSGVPGPRRLDASLNPPPPFAPFLHERSDAVAQGRLAMQKIKTFCACTWRAGLTSRRQLARIAGCSKTAVSDCLRRARRVVTAYERTAMPMNSIRLHKRYQRYEIVKRVGASGTGTTLDTVPSPINGTSCGLAGEAMLSVILSVSVSGP